MAVSHLSSVPVSAQPVLRPVCLGRVLRAAGDGAPRVGAAETSARVYLAINYR